MVALVVRQFGGIAPRTPARYLADTQAQRAVNCPAWLGSLTGLPGTTFVRAMSRSDAVSIYRFGQDIDADDRFWFEFARDTDVVRGAIAGDTEERTYFTDGVKPKKTNAALALTGGTTYPVAALDLGVPRPRNACTAVAQGTGAGAPETRVYTYVFVTDWGEISQPADPSSAVDVAPGQSVSLAMLDTPPSGAHNITRTRIFRWVTGHTAGEYLFVGEIPAAQTTFTDNVTSASLGEVLPSTHWAPPPDTLQGLVALPNGVMAAFSGIDLYYCEPYHPYAWPVPYRQSVEFPIVGLGVMDTTVAVLTTGVPYLAQGATPDQVVLVRSDLHQACVAKRSIVSMGQAVFYASPDGLVALSSAGSSLVTEALFTREQWQALKPETLSGYQWEGKYVGFFAAGGGFIFDPVSRAFVVHDVTAAGAYNDLQRDALYLIVGTALHTWYSGPRKPYLWHSKRFTLPRPLFFSCAAVAAESYPVTLEIYFDQVLFHTQVVASRAPFRLPPGLHEDAEFVITGDVEVFSVALAQSPRELADV